MRGGFRLSGSTGLRFGAAVAVITASVVLAAPRAADASSCLYPDKASGKSPSYSCLKPAERALIELRKFRAEITVAALRCKQQSVYNKIVTRHEDELVAKGKALGSVFRRLYGASAKHELNRYVTHLTNRASIRSLGVANYCGSMAHVFAAALKAPVAGFMAFVRRDPIAVAEAPHNTAPSLATKVTPVSVKN